jgi:hypothetical protein
MSKASDKRVALNRVFTIGAQMSNICFNLKQAPKSVLSERLCASMAECQEEWDAAVIEYRSVTKAKL